MAVGGKKENLSESNEPRSTVVSESDIRVMAGKGDGTGKKGRKSGQEGKKRGFVSLCYFISVMRTDISFPHCSPKEDYAASTVGELKNVNISCV